jgi:N-acetylglucosamine kinase-like BadF-type ATPase
MKVNEKEGLTLKFIVGIDGGGTKTTMEIRTVQTGESRRKVFGAFNINSTGEELFGKLLRELFDELVPISDCECICIGAAGISNPLVQKMIMEVAGEYRYSGKIILKGDHEIALRGALGTDYGMILISGTGSICYGKSETGRIARAGGWGHLIDDGGSAYALARDGFVAVVQSCDGRREQTLLKQLYFQKLGIHTPEEIVPFLYHPQTEKGSIASFSMLVEQAAGEGDRIAKEIIHHNSCQLMDLVRAVYNRLSVQGSKLALLGGMMCNDTILREELIDQIKNCGLSIEYTPSLGDAVSGAVYLALDLINSVPNKAEK